MLCIALCENLQVWEIRWAEDSEQHIARHKVDPAEVEQVVNTRPRLIKPGRDGTQLAHGTTDAGRHLLVVVAEAEDGRDFVVTARGMDASERRSFIRQAQ